MSADEKVKTFEDSWNRMDALHTQVNLGGGDDPGFTAIEYAQKYQLNLATARGRLLRMATEEKLVAGWRGAGRKRMRVYRFPEE